MRKTLRASGANNRIFSVTVYTEFSNQPVISGHTGWGNPTQQDFEILNHIKQLVGSKGFEIAKKELEAEGYRIDFSIDENQRFHIQPMKTTDGEEANIVFIKRGRAWLGHSLAPLGIPVPGHPTVTAVLPVTYYRIVDGHNRWIPAPQNWEELIIQQLDDDNDEAVFGAIRP